MVDWYEDTVKLGYNKLGYNEILDITNRFFQLFQCQILQSAILSNLVITNCSFNKKIWPVPRMFVITEFDYFCDTHDLTMNSAHMVISWTF
jgi:hypothetical protein